MEIEKEKKTTEQSTEKPTGTFFQENVAIFQEEAKERLAELEASLLELEKTPNDPDLVSSAFRSMHTIKGSGAMFGFDEIVDFTHDIETVYDLVREGQIKLTPELIALTLQAHDQILKMLQNQDAETKTDKEAREFLTQNFKSFLPAEDSEQESQMIKSTASEKSPIHKESEIQAYRIRFYPADDLFADGTNPILLLNELRELGECLIIAKTERIPYLDEMDPENCYTGWDMILTTRQPKNIIEDVFIFIDESNDVTIELIESGDNLDDDTPDKKIGEILVERGDVKQKDLELFLKNQEPLGEKLTAAGIASSSQIQSALAEQQVIRKLKEGKKQLDVISSIRVPSNKLDKLVDLVGELVTGQARLTQIANATNNISLLAIAEEIERLTSELRDNTMSVRMLNFDTTFNKFRRLVRDLSHDLGREMILKTSGGETELDKKVIEQLNDPLVHIIRNSADHGIESPEERLALGKPKQGIIELSAVYSGAHVLIKISDDGFGLDAESIRNKAVERGLI
ncbi:MAG: Hpt domain-containing protein, partial [Deltaproteobacteria bacterium]|nr:Hpt domain-containing protein [Deltaproteobacteria bacterium]